MATASATRCTHMIADMIFNPNSTLGQKFMYQGHLWKREGYVQAYYLAKLRDAEQSCRKTPEMHQEPGDGFVYILASHRWQICPFENASLSATTAVAAGVLFANAIPASLPESSAPLLTYTHPSSK